MNVLNLIARQFAQSQASTEKVEVQDVISKADKSARVRLAETPNLRAEYLADLANDDSPEVRISVADNPNTPVAILELLSADDDPDVRYALAENANLHPHILKLLARDENPYIAVRAEKTLARLQQAEVYVALGACA